MAKTINRRPFSVNVPNNSDIKKHYFNHVNWKGICTDKNYFNIDQETFESATNVYMDTDAILKSRPVLRVYDTDNILNVWKFDDLTVYLKKSPNYCLDFVLSTGEHIISDENYTEHVKLLAHDGKIWIFDSIGLFYFNGKEVLNGEEYIYIPVNTIVNDDVETLQKEDNVLTTKKVNRYIYDTTNATFASVYGKDVSVTLNDVTVDFTNFKSDYLPAIVKRTKYRLTSKNFADEFVLGCTNEGRPLIDVADNGKMILCEYERSTVNDLPYVNWTIYYSDDYGNVFTKAATVDNIMGMPTLTKDGQSIGVVKEDGVYFIKPGEVDFRKSTFEFALSSNNMSNSWPKKHAYGVTGDIIPVEFNYNVSVKLYAESETDYYVYYGDGPLEITSVEIYPTIGADITLLDGTNWQIRDYDYSSTGIAAWYKFPCYQIYKQIHVVNDKAIVSKEDLSSTDYFIFPAPSIVNNFDENLLEYRVLVKVLDGDFAKQSYYYSQIFNVDGEQLLDLYLKGIKVPIVLKFTDFYNDRIVLRTYGNHSSHNYLGVRTTVYKIVEDTLEEELSMSSESDYYIVIDKGLNSSNELKYLTETDYVSKVDENIKQSKYTIYGNSIPIYLNKQVSIIVDYNSYLYTSKFTSVITFDEFKEGALNIFAPTFVSELNDWYFATDKNLYISQSKYNDEGEFLWNFPKSYSEQFTYDITNLHIISDTQVAVFFNDHVWIVTYDSENNLYRYNKSRLQVGCKKGNNILTAYDGSQTIFSTEQGLVAMAYKDFVASTEQTLTYLSDAIFELYKDYNENVIKLQKCEFWIFCYAENGNDCYVFDTRNNSWWYWKFPINIEKLYLLDYVKILSDGKLYSFLKTNEDYYDIYYDEGELKQDNVNWSFTSQKLHLSTLNYYKNVENITINSVQEDDYLCTYNLLINNYRESIDKGVTSGFEYYVDKIRTYVKWINYGKLTAFQYTLNNDFDYAVKYPLSINSIIVKYKIGGAVR